MEGTLVEDYIELSEIAHNNFGYLIDNNENLIAKVYFDKFKGNRVNAIIYVQDYLGIDVVALSNDRVFILENFSKDLQKEILKRSILNRLKES